MPKGKSLDQVLTEAERIVDVWEENTAFAMNEVTLASLKAMVEGLRAARAETEETRVKLTGLVNGTNEKAVAVSDVVTRALSGFRAFYGPDSTQYKQAGGTRTSERKKPTRKTTTKG